MTDNALALIEPKNVAQYFAPSGLDPVIEKIREQVAGIVPDISTKKGRDEIASLAYKVAKSKTALDEMGKNLVSGMKEQVKAIDAERSRAWDAIEAIQKEVRAPLTEWENAERNRVADHEAALAEIETAGRLTRENWQTVSLEAMQNKIKELLADARDWQEFVARAERVKEQAVTEIAAAIQKRSTYDAEQAELARLRQQEAERQQREHEERIAVEAAARAQAEAKAEADALAARVAAEQKAAAEREEAARRELAEAEARAARAEADRVAAEEKAERDRVAAAEQAKRDAEAAAKAERDRIAAELKAAEDAAAKREADKKHRRAIDKAALAGFVAAGLPEDIGRMALEAIARGDVPNVRIAY